MRSRVSRRAVLSACSLLASAGASASQTAGVPEIEQARQQQSRNAQLLAKCRVDRHVEPAFRFEA
ncbi:MAG: hypothetical protein HXY18_05450 [Bryobacteraceae bacterium]|nr:hypothetical protein [Bryobacteraceae bacterium]